MSSPRGVYFRREDYASFWRRILVDLIDFGVLAAACLLLLFLLVAVIPSTRVAVNAFLFGSLFFAVLYLIVLRRSRFRTVGYRVARVRMVGLDGRPPGYASLVVRFAFSVL